MSWSARILFVDGSSGTKGGDNFGMADAVQIGGITLLRALRVWAPPFSPTDVIAEVIQYARSQHIPEVWGDNWSGALLQELFARQALPYHLSPLSKGDLYLRLLPLINSGRVRLLDHPQLLRELRGLERRRGWGGRDRVDHRRGAHDDAANAAAGAIVLAAEGALRPPVRLWGGGIRDEEDEQAERQSNHEDMVDRIRRGGGVYFPGIDG